MADEHDTQRGDRQDSDETGSTDADREGSSAPESDDAEGEKKSDGDEKPAGNGKPDGDGDNSGETDDEDAAPRGWSPLTWTIVIGVVLIALAIGLFLALRPRPHPSTEDAYVVAHYAAVAPRIAGQVASVTVDDHTPVRAGQAVATLDRRDLEAALDQALATRAANIGRLHQAEAQIARQPAVVTQARGQVAAAEARLSLARIERNRYADLASDGSGSIQQRQRADAEYRSAAAALVSASGDLESQRRQTAALTADREAAAGQVGNDDAAVRQARLNLSYARIVAPIDGAIAQRTVQVGDQVQPGAAIMMVVPLDRIYVLANFREVELRHMRPGQAARIHVDAYDIDLAGHVASIGPASGATFSPVPPNNATGNFTKIVQRLPVKIVVDPRQRLARLLRAGMSVEVTVDTLLEDVVGLQATSDRRVTAP